MLTQRERGQLRRLVLGDLRAGAGRTASRSHAPFHFDLSILDIYVPLQARRDARADRRGHRQGRCRASRSSSRSSASRSGIRRRRSSRCWPSSGSSTGTTIRRCGIVLFAGEVFSGQAPADADASCWPAPRYFNLYGPTETNVCTYPRGPRRRCRPSATTPYPIGRHLLAPPARACWTSTAPGRRAGHEGELCIAGPGVMQGYWNAARADGAALSTSTPTERAGTGPATSSPKPTTAATRILGRRDRMVKRRGYRVELGEIEAGAVPPSGDQGGGGRRPPRRGEPASVIVAFLRLHGDANARRSSR